MKRLSIAAALLVAACGQDPAPEAGRASPAQALPPPAASGAAPIDATPAATSAPKRYFYFGNHVPRAEIVAVEGVDTASARLIGQTTAEDNYDYCIGYAPGDDAATQARCASQRVAPPRDEMTADCLARTVSDGEPAVWVRDEPGEDGRIRPVWQDRASGQIRDYSGAGGGLVLTAAFRILCPTASAKIAPDPS